MGRTGRRAIAERLGPLKQRLRADFIIVNGENASGGMGLTAAHARLILDAGADVVTLGDHAFDQKDMLAFIDAEPRVLRPLNYAREAPGRGARVFADGRGRKVLVAQALGQVFMKRPFDDPFSALDGVLRAHVLGGGVQAAVIDFHAEATSEKMAAGHFCDGRASLVVGTHTHVPTADAQILSRGEFAPYFAVANIVGALAVGYALIAATPSWMVGAWALVVVAVNVLLMRNAASQAVTGLSRLRRKTDDTGLLAGVVGRGLLWCSLPVYAYPDQGPQAQAAIGATLSAASRITPTKTPAAMSALPGWNGRASAKASADPTCEPASPASSACAKATRAGSGDPATISAFMRGPDFELAAYKGAALTVRSWDGQLRQPVLLASARSLVSVSPQPGFLHERSELDTLGQDQPESQCRM